jgi:hypothetical protein
VKHNDHDSVDPSKAKIACLHVLHGEIPPVPGEKGDLLCRFCWQLKSDEEERGVVFKNGRLLQLIRALCPGCAQECLKRWNQQLKPQGPEPGASA